MWSRVPPDCENSVSPLCSTPDGCDESEERSLDNGGDGKDNGDGRNRRKRRVVIDGSLSSSPEKQTNILSSLTCDQGDGVAGRETRVWRKKISAVASVAKLSQTQHPMTAGVHDTTTGGVPGGNIKKVFPVSREVVFLEEALATPDILVSRETSILFASATDNNDNSTDC